MRTLSYQKIVALFAQSASLKARQNMECKAIYVGIGGLLITLPNKTSIATSKASTPSLGALRIRENENAKQKRVWKRKKEN